MTFQQLMELRRKRLLQGRQPQPRTGPFANRFGPPNVPPQTWGGLLTSMGGAEDRLDSMPNTETTTVIKESLDPEIATTKTTTIKGDPDFAGRGAEHDERGMQDWYAHMAQAQARQQQGTAAPDEAQARAALTDAARQSWDYSPFGLPANIAKRLKPGPGTDFFGGEPTAPPGPVPPPQVDVGQGDFPGRTAEFDERGMQDWNAQMAQLRNRQETGGAAPTQAQVEESLGRYGDFRRQQLTPPPVGRTFGQDDPMAYAPHVDPQRQALRDQEQGLNALVMPTRLTGQDLPREVTEGVGEGDVIDTRPRGTMGEGGLTQGIGELPKINDTSQADRNKMRENPNLEQIWGKYAYDPAARKKAYLDNLKKIYRKAMLLDAIAALTGGESRSKQYLEMATGRLNEIDKFDEEERISNIWREVFTNDEGKFDMPSSKSEAGRRAAQLGASPKTIKDIFGSVSEEKKRDQYFKVDPNDPTKWEIKRFDSDPGEEWIRGTPTATSPVKDKSTYHIKNLRHWEELKKNDPELADSFGRQIGAIPRDKTITPSKWASIIAQDIANDRILLPEGMTGTEFIQQFLTQDEVEYLDSEENKKTMPGYNKWTGQQASKDEVESAVKDSGGEEEKEEGEETVKGTFANEAEAEGALAAGKIKKGDLIIIGNRKARV